MKKWETPIPKTPRQRDRKRCYSVWTRVVLENRDIGYRHGGKIVWMTDKQLTFARIKYPNNEFEEILERDRLEDYKKYLDQTLE